MTDSNSIRAIITDYDSHADAIRSIRDQVFLVEQQISPDDEYDDRDSKCVFAVAFLDNVAVGTGRLDVEKHGKVGRVAVLSDARRKGVGRAVMIAFEEYVQQQTQLEEIWFHAQRSAVDFYLALDYEIVGEEFMEADIPHVKMTKSFVRI